MNRGFQPNGHGLSGPGGQDGRSTVRLANDNSSQSSNTRSTPGRSSRTISNSTNRDNNTGSGSAGSSTGLPEVCPTSGRTFDQCLTRYGLRADLSSRNPATQITSRIMSDTDFVPSLWFLRRLGPRREDSQTALLSALTYIDTTLDDIEESIGGTSYLSDLRQKWRDISSEFELSWVMPGKAMVRHVLSLALADVILVRHWAANTSDRESERRL